MSQDTFKEAVGLLGAEANKMSAAAARCPPCTRAAATARQPKTTGIAFLTTVFGMKNGLIKNVIILVPLSLLITLSFRYVKYTENDIIRVPSPSYSKVAGFPFPYYIEYTENARKLIDAHTLQPLNIPLMFILSLAFWFVSLLATSYILKTAGRVRHVLISSSLAIGLLFVWVKTSALCVAGFPVPFYSSCLDIDIPGSYMVIVGLLDLLFWLGISVSLTACHVLMNNIYGNNNMWKRIKAAVYPLTLVVLSLVFEYSGSSFIWSFRARGFPLPYLEFDGRSHWLLKVLFLSADFAFWLLVYLICSMWAEKAERRSFLSAKRSASDGN